MKGRKKPFFLGIVMMALPLLPGVATAQSETFDPFKNGVGIACENKKPQFSHDHLFFLFTNNREFVARLMFANDALARQYNILFPKVDKMHAVSKNILSKAEKFGANKNEIDIIYSSLDLCLPHA